MMGSVRVSLLLIFFPFYSSPASPGTLYILLCYPVVGGYWTLCVLWLGIVSTRDSSYCICPFDNRNKQMGFK